MEQNYLLTYKYVSGAGIHLNTYEWFTNETELKDAIEDHRENLNSFKVIDCIEIFNAREIDLEQE